jgi:hypothetical protein
MALTLGQGAQLIASVGYNNRVKVAMVNAAIAVSTETQGANSPTLWLKRRQLANRIITSPETYLPSFVTAIAADPATSLSWFAPVNITSSTNANPIAVTTSSVHGLTNGDVVEIEGHLVNTNANGVWTVTVTNTTVFTIPKQGNGAGTASGTVMEMINDNDIRFTINSVFSAVAGRLPEDG